MGLCDRLDLRGLAQFGADRNHSVNACLDGAGDQIVVFTLECVEVDVAVAVGDLGGGHERALLRSGPASGLGVDCVERIKDDGGGVKVDGTGVGDPGAVGA